MARKDEIIIRIQRQALEEFIKNGVQATTMEGIARAAETTKRTLYKYYPTKKNIFNEIVTVLLDRVDAYSDFKYTDQQPIEKQIRNIIDKKIELMTNEDYVKTSKLLSIELIKANPIDESHFERFNKSEAKFINWIKAAQEDKKLTCSHSAELIASQFHSIMKGEIFYPALFGMNEITNTNITTCKEVSWSFIKNYLI